MVGTGMEVTLARIRTSASTSRSGIPSAIKVGWDRQVVFWVSNGVAKHCCGVMGAYWDLKLGVEIYDIYRSKLFLFFDVHCRRERCSHILQYIGSKLDLNLSSTAALCDLRTLSPTD